MKKLLVLIMTLLMVLSLCACGGKEEKTDNNADTNTQNNQTASENESVDNTVDSFTVTVVDQDGNAVKGVMVQICKEACVPAIADENGVATFNNIVITDGYKLSVMSCPEGYETEYVGENYIYLEEGITEYTLEITKK